MGKLIKLKYESNNKTIESNNRYIAFPEAFIAVSKGKEFFMEYIKFKSKIELRRRDYLGRTILLSDYLDK